MLLAHYSGWWVGVDLRPPLRARTRETDLITIDAESVRKFPASARKLGSRSRHQAISPPISRVCAEGRSKKQGPQFWLDFCNPSAFDSTHFFLRCSASLRGNAQKYGGIRQAVGFVRAEGARFPTSRFLPPLCDSYQSVRDNVFLRVPQKKAIN